MRQLPRLYMGHISSLRRKSTISERSAKAAARSRKHSMYSITEVRMSPLMKFSLHVVVRPQKLIKNYCDQGTTEHSRWYLILIIIMKTMEDFSERQQSSRMCMEKRPR